MPAGDPQDMIERLELRPDWHQEAACRTWPNTLFFPEKGDTDAIHRAKSICRECDVRALCLDYAIDNSINIGIWGGETTSRRRKIRRARG